MNVGVVGTGPATESVAAVLGDEGIDIETIESEAVPDVDLAVVVDSVGVARFDAANEAALAATGTEWIAIELGGIGGHTLEGVEATVTGLGPGMGCFECLAATRAPRHSKHPIPGPSPVTVASTPSRA